MHQRVAIHDTNTALTSNCRNTSEQHKDIGNSRSKQDQRDLFQIRRWVNTHHLFDQELTELRLIPISRVACVEDGVNCDDVERIDAHIQTGLDGSLTPTTTEKAVHFINTKHTCLYTIRIHS